MRREVSAYERRRQREEAKHRFSDWDDRNPYHQPERCGVELVATLEDDEAYAFDIVILIRDLETGGFYMAADSGCSCPTPFERLRELSDLTQVRTLEDVKTFVRAAAREYHAAWTQTKRRAFIRKAQKALRPPQKKRSTE